MAPEKIGVVCCQNIWINIVYMCFESPAIDGIHLYDAIKEQMS